MKRLLAIVLLLPFGCSAGASHGSPEEHSGPPAEVRGDGRFVGLGHYHRSIATESPEAQALFDQGLAFLYAFNHDEARRAFEKAAAADPKCAMAAWGVAVANGPHINNPMVDEAHAKAAWDAISKARALGAAGVERDLVEAQAQRYSSNAAADRGPLDKAYADAMRTVWQKYSKDADVGALFAEGMMDLRPWDLWTHDGRPQPGTDEIVSTLETVMALDPSHPFALHLYIHAVEASPHPEKGDMAAARLRDLTPGLGHLVHMPSHIDVRRGRWQEAIAANLRAIAADAEYRRRSPEQGFYHVYMAHNRHMLAFASMMRGESAQATRAIADMLSGIPDEFVQNAAPVIDGFFSMPYELHLRFGRWDQMLAEKEPREIFPLTRTLWHYARGVAYAAKGEVGKARAEQKVFAIGRDKIAKEATFGNNAAADITGVAAKLLDGEILYREGRADEAFAALREAVVREDALRYDEPPDWIQPTRHVLGAALLASGRAAEAESVYRKDLERLPENGWSLLGLARSLEMQHRNGDEYLRRFDEVWREADIKVSSSCLCLPGAR